MGLRFAGIVIGIGHRGYDFCVGVVYSFILLDTDCWRLYFLCTRSFLERIGEPGVPNPTGFEKGELCFSSSGR